ncbi:MAG: recombinase RecA [Halanaerobiales bacterium]
MSSSKDVIKLQNDINKTLGSNILITGNKYEKLKIEWISSGLANFDIATKPHVGAGGIPKGRLVEIYGPEGSGKTSLALSTIAEAQKQGIVCAFFDAEGSFDPFFAEDNFNVNTDSLIISRHPEGEKVLDAVEAMAVSGEVGLIVIDSVAALPSMRVLKESNEKDHVAPEARMWSQALRKLTSKLVKNNCTLILINQLRENPAQMYGNPEQTPGGRAIKFYASMRIEVKKRKSYQEGSGDTISEIGHLVRFKIVKNKVGGGKGTALVDFYNDKGFDKIIALIEAAESVGVIERGGAWYKYESLSEDLPNIQEQGKDALYACIKEMEQDKKEKLIEEIKSRLSGGNKSNESKRKAAS